MNESIENQIRHLHEVEGLSHRQIAGMLKISRKKIRRLIQANACPKREFRSIITPYVRLIGEWYLRYPSLKAIQVLERLRPYGFTGGYTTVKEFTRHWRKKRRRIYHELEFLPGEEMQVDWMQCRFPFGMVHGFVFVLSYSRHLYGRFYPGSSMEFFLEGHMEAFREIGGIPHRGRYDNLKSVVIRRKPEIVYNGQFLDFARHHGFSIYLCTPGRANEKGRVERVIRDMEDFVMTNCFRDLDDLNRQFALWRKERNQKVHRTTGKPPCELLKEEKLKAMPRIPYKPYRVITAAISSTGFVSFETNRYSVPSSWSARACTIMVYPQYLEMLIEEKKIAIHKRSFLRNQKVEHPAHREKLLDKTPLFKLERIRQLMIRMDKSLEDFINRAEEEGEDPFVVSHDLFRLLKGRAKETLISAVREAYSIGIYKAAYITNLLEPTAGQDNPVYPQDAKLLNITYEGRELKNYDELI